MASVLKSYDWEKNRRRGGNVNGSKGLYPWEKWFDGKIRRLRRGEGKGKDFAVPVHNFLHVAYKAAGNRGLRVRAVIEDEKTVVMQARER